MKIVINTDFGIFKLSNLALEKMAELGNEFAKRALTKFGKAIDYNALCRHDPILVKVVETIGDKASTCWSDIHIVEIPDNTEYEISSYDGKEWVSEKHRTWRYESP